MKVVGIYRELTADHNPSLDSICSSAGLLSIDQSQVIVRYLEAGVPVFDVMESTIDPFDGKTRIDGGPSLISDGIWVWRNDLAYFVQKYRIGLSPEFVAHAVSLEPPGGEESQAIVAKWEDALAAYEKAEQGL